MSFKVKCLFNTFHQRQHFFLLIGKTNHLNAHRKTCATYCSLFKFSGDDVIMRAFVVLLVLPNHCDGKRSSRHVEGIPYLGIHQNGKQIFRELVEICLASLTGHDDIVQTLRFPPVTKSHPALVESCLVSNVVFNGEGFTVLDN